MRDEGVGEAEPLLQGDEQAQHAGLHRDVERRCRLIQNQHVWLGGERTGEGGALALAAGKRGGVAGRELAGQADEIEQFGDAPDAHRAIAGEPVHGERQRHALSDGAPRIERRERILLHHLQPAAERLRERRVQRHAVEPDLAAVRPLDAEQHPPERRFPRAGFTDDGERLAARHRQADAVERVDATAADAVAAVHVHRLDQHGGAHGA